MLSRPEYQQRIIDHFKEVRKMTPDEAHAAMEIYFMGYDTGVTHGQAEAQRHLRLLLGLEVPTMNEAVYWSAPFPLKERP